jgi:hypothetical protein
MKRHMELRRLVRRTLSMNNFISGLFRRVAVYVEPRVICAVLEEVSMKKLLKID